MKRILLLSVVFVSVLFTSCTDNTLEEIEKRNELQAIDPGSSGRPDTEDEERTGHE